MGRASHHESLTRDDYSDGNKSHRDHYKEHRPKDERQADREARRNARQSAREGFDKNSDIDQYSNAREKALAATRAEAKELWKQVARENLQFEIALANRYDALVKRVEELTTQLKSTPNDQQYEEELTQKLRDLKEVRRRLREIVRRHVDFRLDDPHDAQSLREHLGHLEELGLITEQERRDYMPNPGELPEDGRPGDGRPGDGRPDDGRPDDGRPDEGGTDEGGTDEGGTDEGGTDEGGTDEGGTDEGGTDEGGTDEGGTDEGGTDEGGTDEGGTDDIDDREGDGLGTPPPVEEEEGDDDGDESPEDPEDNEALREKNRETASEAFEALQTYLERHRTIEPKLEAGVPNGVGRFTFNPENGAMDEAYAALDGLRQTLEDSLSADDPNETVKGHAEALKARIATETTDLDAYEDLYSKTAEAERQRDGFIGLIVPVDQQANPEAYFTALATEMGADLSFEFNYLKGSVDGLKTLIDGFNTATTLEDQRQKLTEITSFIQQRGAEFATVAQTIDAYTNDDGTTIRTTTDHYMMESGRLSGAAQGLQSAIADTPTAWNLIGHWNRGEGLFSSYVNVIDQVRDNVYHARLFGAGNIPPFEGSGPLEEVTRAQGELAEAWAAFNAATTPAERLAQIPKIREANHELSLMSEKLETAIVDAEQKAETAGTTMEDSYVGFFTPGNLDEISKSSWVEKSDSWYGKTGRYLAQFGLGLGSSVEGLAKWAVGVGVGVPLMVKTIPTAIYKAATEGAAAGRAEMDDNTLIATVNSVLYDGVVKNLVGNTVGRLWPDHQETLADGTVLETNGIKQWAFADDGGTNHMNDALWTMGGGIKNWFGFGEDESEAFNGYGLGEAIGTVGTILVTGGGGAAARGGAAVSRASLSAIPGRLSLGLRNIGRRLLRRPPLAPAAAPALETVALAETAQTLRATVRQVARLSATTPLDELQAFATSMADDMERALARARDGMPAADITAVEAAIADLRGAQTLTTQTEVLTRITAAEALIGTELVRGLATVGALPAAVEGALAGLQTAVNSARGIAGATDAGLVTAATDLATQLEAMITTSGSRMGPDLLARATRTLEELRAANTPAATATPGAAANPAQTLLYRQLRISTQLADDLGRTVALSSPLEAGLLGLETASLRGAQAALDAAVDTMTLAELEAVATRSVQALRDAARRFTGTPLEQSALEAATRIETAMGATGSSTPATLATALRAEAQLAGQLSAEVGALALTAEVGMISDLASTLRGLEGASGLLNASSGTLRSVATDMTQALRNSIERMRTLGTEAGVDNAALIREAEAMATQLAFTAPNGSARVVLADLQNAGRLSGRIAEHLEAVALQAERAIPARQLLTRLGATERTFGTLTPTSTLTELTAHADELIAQFQRAADYLRPTNAALAAELDASILNLRAAVTASTTPPAVGAATAEATLHAAIVTENTAILVNLNAALRTAESVAVRAPAAPRVLSRQLAQRMGASTLVVGAATVDRASGRELDTPIHLDAPDMPEAAPLADEPIPSPTPTQPLQEGFVGRVNPTP